MELPYAGIDSVCPECGSPLAALARSSAETMQATPPPPPIVERDAQPVQARAPGPVYEQDREPYARQTQWEQPDRHDYEDDRPARSGMLQFAQFAVVGAVIALVGFLAWWMFAQRNPSTQDPPTFEAGQAGELAQGVQQISPPEVQRAVVTTEAREQPDPSAPLLASLPAGQVLDVTGRIETASGTWLRVSMPNNASRSGFVRADQLSALGTGDLALEPTNGVLGGGATASPGAVPEVIGPIEPMQPATYYVASKLANIRASASALVGQAKFSDGITVIGQRSIGTRIWYQVQLPGGGEGWVNGGLLALQVPSEPIDSAPPKAPPATAPGAGETPGSPPASTPAGPSTKPAASEDASAQSPGSVAESVGTVMRVISLNANLRATPGTAPGFGIDVLAKDQLVTVEDVKVLNGVPWYQVTGEKGLTGWVSGKTLVVER